MRMNRFEDILGIIIETQVLWLHGGVACDKEVSQKQEKWVEEEM